MSISGIRHLWKKCSDVAPLFGFSLVCLLLFGIGCRKEDKTELLWNRVRPECGGVFFHVPEEGSSPSRVSVVGDFNGWQPGIDSLQEHEDGIWRLSLALEPGTYHYRIWVDGLTFNDPHNPLTLFSNGQELSALIVQDCKIPSLEPTDLTVAGDGAMRATVVFWPALFLHNYQDLDISSVSASIQSSNRGVSYTEPISVEPSSSRNAFIVKADGLPRGKWRLIVGATDKNNNEARELKLPFWVEEEHFAWEDGLIYQVFVDRFRRGGVGSVPLNDLGGTLPQDKYISSFWGGDLDGITEAIEAGYFQSMGANVLWISPLYTNPGEYFIGRDGHPAQPYHSYWPSEPRSVDERVGGERALDRLISVAHDHGIRVLMDIVLNHVHIEHPYFDDNLGRDWFNHPDGDCICGFTCPWHSHIETCWFDPFLADLDWHNLEVVDQLVDDAIYWVDRFNLDGLRVDAVPMMPRLAIRHLRDRLERRLGSAGHHIFLLGETYGFRGSQPTIRWYLGPHSLSGQFDFPVMWALRDAIAGRMSFAALDREVLAGESAWEGSGAVMSPFLGNHDVARFISDVNGDQVYAPRESPPDQPDVPLPYRLLETAWTFVLTQPGIPTIYYGDDIGLAGADDPDNRRGMLFGGEIGSLKQGVLERVRKLGRARDCSLALRRGERTTLLVSETHYVYARHKPGGPYAIVVISLSNEEEVDLEVPIPYEWLGNRESLSFTDVLGHGTISAQKDGQQSTIAISIPQGPFSALFLSEAQCISVE